MKIAAATKPMRMKVGSTPVVRPIVEATPAFFASLQRSEYGYLRAIVISPSSSVRPRPKLGSARGFHGFELSVDLVGRLQLLDLVFERGDSERFGAAFGEVGAAL